MRTVRIILVAFALVLLLTPAGSAQPPLPQPGPEHARLKKLEGTWDATIKTGQGESKGVMTYKMELGGLWLVSNFKADLGGLPFQGKGLDGYDPIKKKYVGVWVDSMSPSLLVLEGGFDKEGKVFTQVGEGPGMDGKMTQLKAVTKMEGPDTMVFSLSGVKDQQPMLTITYKRKK